MVNRRKFNEIKEKCPESRIGQRTWEQEKYRNRLYNTFKRDKKKWDAADVVAEKILKEKQNTREYVSAKYWMTQESAKNMIDDWYFDFVKEHVDAFTEFDNEFAIWLVKRGYWKLIANNFDKFVGLNKEFAMCVIREYYGNSNNFKRSPRGHWDSTWNECIWVILCELIMKNADKVSGLDKEFADSYLNFFERYQRVQSWYAGYYTHDGEKYNSLIVLAENMKFVEWIDEGYLLDYLVEHLHENVGRKRDLCGLARWLLENTDIKFPEDVFNFIKNSSSALWYVDWLCSYLERFEFETLPKDFILDCFDIFLRGDMKDSTNDSTNKRFSDLVKYIQTHPELWITIDDLFKDLYDQGMHYDWKYHMKAAERLVEFLPYISVSKEDILKVYKLIVTHIPKSYQSRHRESLLDCLSKFESYIIAHPELDISSRDLYYVSMWWDPNEISSFSYKPSDRDTIAWFKEPYRDSDSWNEPWYFNRIFKNLISTEEAKAEAEEKNRLSQEAERKEKQENEWRENIRMIVDESYENWIKKFLVEGNYEHRDYIKNLLLKSGIKGIVTKYSFSKLYDQLNPEEQKILLKKFKKVKLN